MIFMIVLILMCTVILLICMYNKRKQIKELDLLKQFIESQSKIILHQSKNLETQRKTIELQKNTITTQIVSIRNYETYFIMENSKNCNCNNLKQKIEFLENENTNLKLLVEELDYFQKMVHYY